MFFYSNFKIDLKKNTLANKSLFRLRLFFFFFKEKHHFKTINNEKITLNFVSVQGKLSIQFDSFGFSFVVDVIDDFARLYFIARPPTLDCFVCLTNVKELLNTKWKCWQRQQELWPTTNAALTAAALPLR